ncbi:MAG: PrgI family protein [Anaerostipes sp.]|nr:PrgI family protein [Anaerostipes sp.]
MAYVPVPKDLSKVKTKVALNLTKRQIICFVLAGVCGFPVYFLTKSVIGIDVAATLMVILMLSFFFLAMYEKDGLASEKAERSQAMDKAEEKPSIMDTLKEKKRRQCRVCQHRWGK